MRFKHFLQFGTAFFCAVLASLNGAVGLPRGAQLVADEQDADPVSGVTTARGNAELRVDSYRILGRADHIRLDPAGNAIQFTGHASITIGDERYESIQVTCSLDFEKCTPLKDEPSHATPSDSVVQTSPSVESGAAAINP